MRTNEGKLYLFIKKNFIMEVTEFCFGTTQYDILSVTYDYDEEYDFYLSVETQLPADLFPTPLTVTFPLFKCLEDVEKKDADMADYVREVIEKHQNVDCCEQAAFQSLENEGFNLKRFMRITLSTLELRIRKYCSN